MMKRKKSSFSLPMWRSMFNCYCFTAILFFLLLLVHNTKAQKLPRLNIDNSNIGLVGISSGAAMAIQMHVAHSSTFSRVGAVAGPPYWCANANAAIATSSCMDLPGLISITELVAATTYARTTLSIDSTSNLKTAKVWLFSGTKDSVVVPGVTDKSYQYYNTYMPSSNIKLVNTVAAEHAWVTADYGNSCGYLGKPYINNCNYDSAGSVLNHFYSSLSASQPQNTSRLFSFSQSSYTPTLPSAISMDSTGYLYLPTNCSNGQRCRLVVFLHGCDMGVEEDKQNFLLHTGLNDYAETNNLVILYPQVVESVVPYNPKGCWDWWGYTGAQYATKLAPQVAAVKNMVDALAL